MLHSSEEGKVIEIINDKMVLIEIRGVRFPAYIDQIDFPYFHRFSKKKLQQPEKKVVKQYVEDIKKEKKFSSKSTIRTQDGVWLALLPQFNMDEFDDEIVDVIKIYLVNKTDKPYKFNYTQEIKNTAVFELTSEVLAHHDFYLHDIAFEVLNDNPVFFFEFSLLLPNKKKADFFTSELKLKAKQAFRKIEEMKEKNTPTITFPLFNEYPDKLPEIKEDVPLPSASGVKIYDAAKSAQHLPPPRSVVDLHIEKLTADHKGMTNFEILTYQLKEFEKWMYLSLAHRQPGLIVVHGIGTGRLKEEIHEILKTTKEVKTFINQYDPRFGYGATEIFFQYK